MTHTSIFQLCRFNGELLPVEQAKISVFSQAFFSSFGVYEAIKVDEAAPFTCKTTCAACTNRPTGWICRWSHRRPR
jgi:hypothetical protein